MKNVPHRPDIPLDLPALREVAARIGGAVSRTPQWHNDALSRELGATVLLKLENLQHAGSFKIRGATNKIAGLNQRSVTV